MNRNTALAVVGVAAVAGAVALRFGGLEGWGWMVFIAVFAVLAVS